MPGAIFTLDSDTTVADHANFEFNLAGTFGGETDRQTLVERFKRVACVKYGICFARTFFYHLSHEKRLFLSLSVSPSLMDAGAFAAERSSLTIDTGRGQANFANNTAVLGNGGTVRALLMLPIPI